MDEKNKHEDFFTKWSHLYNISLVFSIQDYYPKGRSMTIGETYLLFFFVRLTNGIIFYLVRNTTERIIFPSKSDTRALRSISLDVYGPGNSSFLHEALEYVEKHYDERYVLICNNALSKLPKCLKMKTHLFRIKNGKLSPIWLKPKE